MFTYLLIVNIVNKNIKIFCIDNIIKKVVCPVFYFCSFSIYTTNTEVFKICVME